MKFLQPNLIAPIPNRFIAVAGGLLIFFTAMISPQAVAQDQMMRRDSGDHGGDHGRGMGGIGAGAGIGLGIGIGILTHQLSQPPQTAVNPKATKKTTTKKVAKKPLPKDEQKPQKANAPETPKINKADTPPPQIPVENPVPPVAGPPAPPPVIPPPQIPGGNPNPPVAGPPGSPDSPPSAGLPPTQAGPPPPPGGVPPTQGGPPLPPESGVPPTQTVSTPPTDQPHTPGTPPPPPLDPTDNDGKQRFYGHDKGDECPQHGWGCAALIIDFTKDTGEADVGQILKTVTEIGCKVDYIAPHLLTLQPDEHNQTRIEEVIKQNAIEKQNIMSKINGHRQKVSGGVELAMEFTFGHGNADSFCGFVTANHTTAAVARAEDLHADDYNAARKNTCYWFAMDLSCFSGMTPEAIDELNNNGEAKCLTRPKSLDSCPAHAAWGGDTAIGSATKDDTCVFGDYAGIADDIVEAMTFSGPGGPNYDVIGRSLGRFKPSHFVSYYKDDGYHFCSEPRRHGYNWFRKPPSCNSGNCTNSPPPVATSADPRPVPHPAPSAPDNPYK